MKLLLIFYAFTCVLGRKYQTDGTRENVFRDDTNTEQENDPKENYFRYMRAYEGDFKEPSYTHLVNVPVPGGFRIYYPDTKNRYNAIRNRREVDSIVDLQLEKIPDEEVLGKPLEIAELEAENSTEINYLIEPKNDLVINDFIRFKRDVQAEEVTEKSENIDIDEKNISGDIDNVRPKREHERSGKMLLSSEAVPEGNREPRGATKEQWIKQPYPVQTTNPDRNNERSDRNYDDSMASSSDSRAPRVHFVTQRRSESAPPLVYHSYDRESRSRDLNRQASREIERDVNRDLAVNRDLNRDANAYYPRPPRHYNPEPVSQNRYDPYYTRDERDRRPDYDAPVDRYYEDDRQDRLAPTPIYNNKQRRIIYYATLPEVVRTPPNVDLRDRYNYHDNRYENRYIASQPVSVGSAGSGESYRYRNSYNPKSRYDQPERNKAPYPVKVSTDVNVHEIKKNPERRIYSEVDRRYPYKLSNYHDDPTYDRNMQ